MPARSFSLTLTAAALKAAAKHAFGAVADKGVTVPILGHLLLRAGPDGLSVTGTDLDHQATARTEAEVAREGVITVPAKTFVDVTGKLPKDDPVRLTADAGELSTTIQCGRARFRLASLDPDDFPIFAPTAVDAGFPYRIELAGKTLAAVLGRAKPAMSKEETRYYLCGIYVHVVEDRDETRLRLVATDGHRLARIDTAHAEGLEPDMPGIIIPRAIVGALETLAADAGDGPVTLELSSALVRLTAGDMTLTSRLIDGTFPDYARIIPTTFARTATAPRQALIEALDRVRVIAEGKTRGVAVAIGAHTIAVSLKRPMDLFEGRDEVDLVALEGEPLTIGFNAKYLAEILAETGGDTVRLHLNTEADPAVLGDKLDEALFVLMPLRVGSVEQADDDAE